MKIKYNFCGIDKNIISGIKAEMAVHFQELKSCTIYFLHVNNFSLIIDFMKWLLSSFDLD